jgi:hypothetical protein
MMRGKLAILGLVLAIALAVTGRVLEVTDGHDDSHVELAVRTMPGPDRADTTRYGPSQGEETPTSKPLHQRPADADQALVAEAKDQTSHHARTKAIEAARVPEGNRAAASAVAVARGSESLDESVVGQPFPVSESILAACKESRRDRTCERGMSLLATFAQEPRKDLWASTSERAIRALVELEPGTNRPRAMTYTIRNLECRKTICFVETASHMKRFSTQFFYFESSNSLNAGYAMDGTETKEDGTKIFVTLLPVVRR